MQLVIYDLGDNGIACTALRVGTIFVYLRMYRNVLEGSDEFVLRWVLLSCRGGDG